MRKLKSKKGITLIALVITIVILILLAGISIAILGGEDGLINKAKEAGKKQKIAEIKEKIGLELMAAETDAILRGEQLELAQRDDIASKYGSVNGDILITEKDNYEIDLKEIYNKTLSESGSYTALKQALANTQNDLATSEANLATAQMSQSEAGAALTELQTNVNNGTVEADKMLKNYTAYKNGAYITGSIESKEAQTYTPGATDKTIEAGQYLSGAQTILGDADLKAENIKEGIEIFGINGTAPGETTHEDTYELAASETGTKDLGVNHSYRYINAANVYNKGLTDGRIVGTTNGLTSQTKTASATIVSRGANVTYGSATFTFSNKIVGITSMSPGDGHSFCYLTSISISGNQVTCGWSRLGQYSEGSVSASITAVGY